MLPCLHVFEMMILIYVQAKHDLWDHNQDTKYKGEKYHNKWKLAAMVWMRSATNWVYTNWSYLLQTSTMNVAKIIIPPS